MIKAITLLIPLLILSSCDQSEIDKWNKHKEQAVVDAKAIAPEVHLAYLQCYALNYSDKIKCVRKLTDKYIDAQYKNNPHYTSSFQHEAEKLGFLAFLSNAQQSCDYIEAGPEFLNAAKAYLVTCNNGKIYFLKFNYDKNVWVKM